MQITIRPMTLADVAQVVALADKLLGESYYTADSVREMRARSTQNGVVCSHVAERVASLDEVGAQLVGFRFSLPPGAWQHGRGNRISPHLWPVSLAHCGYFQTAYVDPLVQRQGVGSRMAAAALAQLRALGARGVVTHCWKESPSNSSFRYLSRLGFQTIVEIPNYWIDVDYICVRDGNPCRCTAIEMFLPLS